MTRVQTRNIYAFQIRKTFEQSTAKTKPVRSSRAGGFARREGNCLNLLNQGAGGQCIGKRTVALPWADSQRAVRVQRPRAGSPGATGNCRRFRVRDGRPSRILRICCEHIRVSGQGRRPRLFGESQRSRHGKPQSKRYGDGEESLEGNKRGNNHKEPLSHWPIRRYPCLASVLLRSLKHTPHVVLSSLNWCYSEDKESFPHASMGLLRRRLTPAATSIARPEIR